VQTAQHRGVYAHAFGSVVQHLHPMCDDSVPDDSTYLRGRTIGASQGMRLLRERCHLWGGDRSAHLRRRRRR
jgi:hypothetical protein